MCKRLLTPQFSSKSLATLDFADFYRRGYRAILLDLDNTLAPYHCLRIDDDALATLKRINAAGLKALVVSNNTTERVKKFLNGHDIPFIALALKPLPCGYLRAIKKAKVPLKQVISVGDQLLTDILGSNILGIYSIYVEPLSKKDSIVTWLSRKIEALLFKYAVKR